MRGTGATCFALYVGLWTAQTLLVRNAVRPNGSYAFDPGTMCCLIELLKLAGALFALMLGGGGAALYRALANAPASFPFALPSVLYTGYNLLQFVNLSLVPAPTFRTAINVKVLFTALFARAVFASARLQPRQWLALCLLALGCAVSQLNERLQPISAGAFGLICLQGSLSSLAGVYTQWLMQLPHAESARELGFWEKGAYLYAWGAAVNLLYLALFRPQAIASTAAFFAGYDAHALAILTNGALAGFSTALLLQLLSAIAKEFANAAEIVTTALVGRALYDTPLPGTLSAGAALVIGSMAMFEAAGRRSQSAAESREQAAGCEAERDSHASHERQPLLLPASEPTVPSEA